MDYTRKNTYPAAGIAAGIAGLPNAVDYGESNLKAQAYQSQKCEQANKPATELAADLHNLIGSNERALRLVEQLSDKLFGPAPEELSCEKTCYPDHLTATVHRARMQSEKLVDNLERINANI